MTQDNEAPSISDSMDAFMGVDMAETQSTSPPQPAETPAAPEAASQPAAANTPPVDQSQNPTGAQELDLSGGIEPSEVHQDPEPEAKLEAEVKDVPVNKLRRQYAKTKSELAKLQSEIVALKAQPKSDANSADLEAVKKESESLKQRLAQVEAARDDASKKLAKVDIVNSPEFKQKYYQPWKEAQERALADISEFTKTNDAGEQVPMDWNDFKPILTASNHKEAVAKARELFGDDPVSALFAVSHRQAILGKQQEYAKALERHEAERANIEAERAKQGQNMHQLFESESNRIRSEYPNLYTTDSKNPSETEYASKGEKIAKAALFGIEGMTPETRVRAAAVVYQRAAHFPVIAMRLSDAQMEIARLSKEVESLKNGLPGGGSGSSNGDSLDDEESIGASMDKFRSNY